MAETYAWQCGNCGALVPDDHATDYQSVPAVCAICQHGVKLVENPHGSTTVIPDPGNWIILADLEGGELTNDPKRKNLTPDKVVRHVVKRTLDHPRKTRTPFDQ